MPKTKANSAPVQREPGVWHNHGIVYRLREKPMLIESRRGRFDPLPCTHEVRTDSGTFHVTSEQAGHDLIATLAKVAKQKNWPPARTYKPAGQENLKPPSFKRFGCYRWSDDHSDFVIEYRNIADAVRAADGYTTRERASYNPYLPATTIDRNRVAVTANVAKCIRERPRIVREWKLDGYYLAPVVLIVETDDSGDDWIQFQRADAEGDFLLPDLEWTKESTYYHAHWPNGNRVLVRRYRSKWEVANIHNEYGILTDSRCDTLKAAKHRAAELYAEHVLARKNDETYELFERDWKSNED